MSSRATISPDLSIAFDSGIWKMAKALFGVLRKLMRFKSELEIILNFYLIRTDFENLGYF